MSGWRRTALGLVLVVALILVAASLIVPRVVNMETLRQRVATLLSERIGGSVQLETLRPALWPLPHVVAEQVSVAIPGTVQGTFAWVSVYPKMSALLSGNLEVATVRLAVPDLKIQLRHSGGDSAESSPNPTRPEKQAFAALASVVAAAANQVPGMVVMVTHGRVTVSLDDDRPFTFSDLDAHVDLPPDRLHFTLTCASDFWERLTVTASLDGTTLAGSGSLDVTRLRPHALSASLLPRGDLQVGDSEVSFAAQITTDGQHGVHAEIDGSIPKLTVRRGDTDVVLRANAFKATAQMDERTTKFVATGWQFTAPPLQLSGELTIDRLTPRVSLQVDATDIDAGSVGHVAKIIAADEGAVHQIFDVLRGGAVSRVSVHTEGPTFEDLGNLDALAIDGHLNGGEVRVPGVDLDLREVTGDASVAHGVLKGDRVSARLGKAQASDGSLRVGLAGDQRELHVETSVQADAAELPGLLKRFVTDESVRPQLDQLRGVEGTASGTLLLTGTTKDVSATVDVSAFDVSGRVEGFRQPMRITGGRFIYDAAGVSGSELTLTIGGSSLSHLAAHLDRRPGQGLFEASAGASRIVLDEVYPWLAASGWLRASPWNPAALSGTLNVRSGHVDGPAATPTAWRFEVVGAADKLDIDSSLLRQHIAIRYPLSLNEVRLGGDATGVSFVGKFTAPDALTGTVDLSWNADQYNLKQFAVRDANSNASLSLLVAGQRYDVAFTGTVTKNTLNALVPDHHLLDGEVRGDLRAHILLDQPTRSTIDGHLEATQVHLPGSDLAPLSLTNLSLDAKGGTVSIDAAMLAGADDLHVSGSVRPSPDKFVADLDLGTSHLDWRDIEPLLPSGGDGAGGAAGTSTLPVRGTVRLNADSFTYDRFTWRPLRAALTLNSGGPVVRVSEANLCGIATPGTITMNGPDVQIAFKPTARQQQLADLVKCLGAERQIADGRYDLAAQITALGRPAGIVRAARGQLEFTATNGRTYQLSETSKVLAVVNVATGAFGDVSNVTKQGIPYSTLNVKADLSDGALVLSEAVFDGPTMKTVAEGSINLIEGTIDATMLVAPLASVDSVIKHIPVVNSILGGNLVSIPVKVSGSLSDPSVTPLDPSTVGSRLLGAMTRTLKLPMGVIAPLWSDVKKLEKK